MTEPDVDPIPAGQDRFGWRRWPLVLVPAVLALFLVLLALLFAFGGNGDGDDNPGADPGENPPRDETDDADDSDGDSSDSDEPAPAEDAGPPPPGNETTSGIEVGVSDVFGPEGVRPRPAGGIRITVLADGEEVASATTSGGGTGSAPELTTIRLAPGSYRLVLDIGGYVESCSEGYEIDFELAENEIITFRTNVYETATADDGTSIGFAGPCFELRRR